MAQQKYLLIYRVPPLPSASAPSPGEMQTIFAQWDAWKNKFKSQILDMGDALKPDGRVLKDGVVTDGPFVESKDVVGGYSIVAADSFEQAVTVARDCPMAFVPGTQIEIRELAGY
jgi:hypothetical protein